MTNYVTIARFTLPQDMHLAKAKLESEGVDCEVRDELTVQTDNFLSNAIGGVRLQVRVDDFEQAADVLRDMGIAIEGGSEPRKYSVFQLVLLTLAILVIIFLGLYSFLSTQG